MTTYVDKGKIEYRHMKMCHMLADTENELHAMATKIGIKRGWFQDHSTPHYDICQSKRKLALKFGAVEVTRKELVSVIRKLRVEKNG